MTAWKTSIYLLFAFLGMTFVSVLVRMPEVKETIGVSTAGLGIVLLGGSFGSIPALLIAGRLIERFGTKPLIVIGYFSMALSTAFILVALQLHSAPCMFVALLLFGFCMASADVAINLDGSSIEQKLGRSIMPRLHAGYSVGAFVGVSLGTAATSINFPITIQVIILSALTALLPLLVGRFLPAGTGKHDHQEAAKAKGRSSLFKNKMVVWLALGIFGITLAEGASNDWLVLGFVDGYQVTRTQAGVGYACLMIAMTIARFFGGNIVDRLGRHRALRIFAVAGVAGILLVVLSQNLVLAYFGSALWGIGVALGFPLFISAAGEGEDSARKVSFVTTAGYAAFLVGPPLLGFIGEAIGILQMFYLLALFMAAAAYFASATKASSKSAS